MGLTVSTGNPVSPKELALINQRYIERHRPNDSLPSISTLSRGAPSVLQFLLLAI